MLNIVCVCHNGMGTSMLLKINVNNICMENGISAHNQRHSRYRSL